MFILGFREKYTTHTPKVDLIAEVELPENEVSSGRKTAQYSF